MSCSELLLLSSAVLSMEPLHVLLLNNLAAFTLPIITAYQPSNQRLSLLPIYLTLMWKPDQGRT